ncbi:hypothetical protein [Serratia liquefaciens]|uniref:hypothetical protein n=1 Tax=Serratia liquefaciens TaxID=614 RepID=UPI0010F2FCD8|nr:hypothetical protein [Serratia liquefaciens]RYM70241.1 hypothetical protein BSR00_19405 [Serratia liquefaciens]RYM76517.1 hypothetical protein BSR01_21655 [Serratia liquefaciens]
MAITVYSKRFKRELDKEQLESLYLKNVSENLDDFRRFVHEDAECPICNVTGAHYVSEGYSRITNKKVKQAHFAFRKPDDTDAHKVFCDHYAGPDKVRDSGGDAFIKFGKDGSEVTILVRELVCRGIENNIFNQTDIRNMRKWFTDLRESGNIVISYSPHVINLLRASFYSQGDTGKYEVQDDMQHKSWFNINDEVYKSLKHKYPPFFHIDLNNKENKPLMRLYSNTLARQAYRLIIKDKGIRVFDRRELNDKYVAAMQLSTTITKQYDFLRRKFTTPLSIMRNNQLLAVSALLLFVSDWDEEIAREKFNMLTNAGTSIIPDAGNVIGMNPFIHYDAWKVIHRVQDLIDSLPDLSNLDEEFQAEKQRLSELYGLNKDKA